MRKRGIKILVKSLLALFALLVVFLLFERVRGQISLARYRQRLIAQGEKLSARDFVSSASESENGAPEVFEATKRLREGVVLPKSYPLRMKLTSSGRAVVGFREPEWIDDKVANRWEQLAADLKANEATLREIRRALEKPVLNNHVDWSQGMKMQFPHLAPAKSLTYWFGSASLLALHEGKTHESLEYLLAQVRLPRLLSEDRLLISELVRIAIGAIGRADTWEALQAEGWTDEDLVALQKAWESQVFADGMARSLEGERIFDDASYAMMRDSHQDAVGGLFGLEELFDAAASDRPAWEKFMRELPYGGKIAGFLKKQVYARIWRFAWSHQDQQQSMEVMQCLIEIARRATTEKSIASIQDDITLLDERVLGKNLYDKLRYPNPQSFPTISRCVGKAMRAETERSITICAIALKRRSLRHGKLPPGLDALVPEFLSSVPTDYMDGQPMKYHLNSDGSFKLYSVGENGKDDGGDASLLPEKSTTRNLWDRKDYVWPAPALPEEIEAYRQEAAKN